MKESVFARFTDKYSVDDAGCWAWTAYTTPTGYGRLQVEGKSRQAHRLSYEHFNGPIPEGKEIDHLCRNRACVNPEHLEAVTHKVNTRRGIGGINNRSKTHCPQGHPYDENNTGTETKGRYCKACKRERVRARRARNTDSERT